MLTRFGLLSAALFLAASAFAFAADEKKETTKVEEGKPAPAFDLPATQIDKVLPDKKDAKTISLKDFEGKKNVVLFFYPKAMTGGCTKECIGFSKTLADFAKTDTVLLGISVDKLDKQMEFTEKETLTIPLLADPEKKITTAYGALNEKAGFSNRYTYVIDKKGIVRKIYNKVDPEKHPEEVLKYIQENLADKK